MFPCWTKKHLCVLSFFCCVLLTLITTRAEVLWHSTKKKVNGKRICAHCGIQYINRLEILNSSNIFAFEFDVFWDRNTVDSNTVNWSVLGKVHENKDSTLEITSANCVRIKVKTILKLSRNSCTRNVIFYTAGSWEKRPFLVQIEHFSALLILWWL